MTPLTSPSHSPPDGHALLSHHDRPERSRNAKAQARHRAKRKAYIEQLESTVTKLQSVLALSPDQVAALPPPLIRIRELEEENDLLHRQLDDLRRQLDLRSARLRPDLARAPDDDRDARRRRMTDSAVYVVSAPACAPRMLTAHRAPAAVHGLPAAELARLARAHAAAAPHPAAGPPHAVPADAEPAAAAVPHLKTEQRRVVRRAVRARGVPAPRHALGLEHRVEPLILGECLLRPCQSCPAARAESPGS
ncbi:hypothetical protein IEO21_08822 [Rhodonia placenta]|uniref:BZIP domain-containing protein n=1 Tax=Rhodonia placenta TaxID=104341 RepID=A0A8H7NVX7_9APHY|nr:hypothetical protein IEO21_08822 [Postia placenta]